MEAWLTHAVSVYLQRFPCLRVVMLGHSHGAITVVDIASRLEADYADRFIVGVSLDRVEFGYGGDKTSYPQRVPVFNIYETNDPSGLLQGTPRDQPNVENWDASGETVDDKPVVHTTIDNAPSVRDRIVDEVMERSAS
jgi:hypothetical protein